MTILFRLFPSYGVRNLQAIIVNYFTCFTVGSLLYGEPTMNLDSFQKTWFPYAAFLSLTFILFFNVNAYTIQKVGMIITSVFQKLSLVAPVILGLAIFHEEGTALKYLAIVLTLIAIVLINYTSSKDTEMLAVMKKYWYWPLLVFFGSGLIEMVLFYAQESGKVQDAGLAFTSNLFLMAGCWGILFLLVTRKFNFTSRDFLGGVAIGIPNFFTIYLIMKGLADGWEGSVLFPLNNVGVIFFTALVGLFLFKERLNGWNKAGLLLAILAVMLISR